MCRNGEIMSRKIALLSNVNMNFVIRTLKKEWTIYEPEGYGNELGILMNPQSSYFDFQPEITFLIVDLMEILEHDLRVEGETNPYLDRWFLTFENSLNRNQIYYISDAYLHGTELEAVSDKFIKYVLENKWNQKVNELCEKYENVLIFPYHHLIECLGENNSFSTKMWYMGKIPFTSEAQNKIAELISHITHMQNRIAKKVLVLDLDNTLWGGLAGEADNTSITLSEDHNGLAYKNMQRVVLQMQKNGVLLAIISKNNQEDAFSIIDNHSHMVLRREHFAAMKINWEQKHENMKAIAKELNLGLDSFVFWDDNPTERELIQQMLPEVAVPNFPDKVEDYPTAMIEVYHTFFEKSAVTKEDRDRTKQYAENTQRNLLFQEVGNFESYLKMLEIKITRVDACANQTRLVQLVNKTNQFNLTTIRYTEEEMSQILTSDKKEVFLYQVEDKFGDNGIVGAVIVDISTEQPMIEEWVLSCRVMGKNIEYAILEDIEQNMLELGYEYLQGTYIPTQKNKPVDTLYEKCGFQLMRQEPLGGNIYKISLKDRPTRFYCATLGKEVCKN